jgi:TonB family protein
MFLIIGLFLITINLFSQSKLTQEQITERNYREVISSLVADTIVLDKLPMYPDGIQGVYSHFSKNLIYPKKSRSAGIEGKVILKFIVEKNGTINEIEIKQGATPELDAEAIRVLKKLEIWEPGYKEGKPVRVSFIVPITFKLK